MNRNLSPTEIASSKHKPIDTLSDNEALSLMIASQNESILAVEKNKLKIKKIVNKMHDHILTYKKSRLIYVGAGTSGRIGIQDGVELYPTFGWPLEKLLFFMAGGTKALLSPVEDSEDDIDEANRLIRLNNVSEKDIVIGLAASGNTPFTCELIKNAKKLNAFTIGISNNPNGMILDNCKYGLCLDTGSEVVVGSTRLKAGTAQKICLNLISTLLMIKMNRVRDGEMIRMVATNKKLRDRKIRINKTIKKNV